MTLSILDFNAKSTLILTLAKEPEDINEFIVNYLGHPNFNFLCSNLPNVQFILNGNSKKMPVFWDVTDFEKQAICNWEINSEDYPGAESWEDVYDSQKFSQALELMISKHDFQEGINWQTVNYYLDEFCLKDKRKCNNCDESMKEGFVINGGCEYYCNEECLNKHYSKKTYTEMYNKGNSDTYWTTFDD
jgi:hypothetical protein